VLLSVAVLLAAVRPATADRYKRIPFTDAAVRDAVDKAIKHLWSIQKDDGSWGGKNNYPFGPSALATCALLSAGENPNSARMKKALAYLTEGIRGPVESKGDQKGYGAGKGASGDCIKTYTLGLMGNCFALANKDTDGAYRKQLRWVVERLVKSTKNGSYGYTALGKQKSSGDNSNSQYGLLGVWGGVLGNEEIPREYWMTVMKHWMNNQAASGGWAYRGHENSTRTMTAAGIASLYVCFDNLFSEAFIQCTASSKFTPIQKGLDWMERNFTDEEGRIHMQRGGYYLYGVERVGLASGYKYFGKADWYKLGCEWAIPRVREKAKKRGNKKSNPIEMSFMLLFLARGSYPVMVNKLQFEGDWNNRPRDCAALRRYMWDKFEGEPAWQIINLKVPVREWHDAPILYISGAKKPNFTDEQIEKLRTYVYQGGTILSITECPTTGGTAFGQGIREVYRKMFPRLELTPVPDDHDIYTTRVQNDLRGKPDLHMISNGVRPLVIHTDEDLSLQWQLMRTSSQARAFEGFANILSYVTDKYQMRRRGVSHWPEKPEDVQPVATLKLARLKHSGNHNPEPLAHERLARLMLKQTGVKLDVTKPISATKLADSGATIAMVTGVGQARWTDEEKAAIKAFVQGGGTLVVDPAGGNDAFYRDARTMLTEVFTNAPLRIPATSPLYNPKGVPTGPVRYRLATEATLQLQPRQPAAPRLRAVLVDGRRAVFFSREDLTAGLVGYKCYGLQGYRVSKTDQPGTAFRIVRNIILDAAGEDVRKAVARRAARSDDDKARKN
jgi:hypothetical protein